VDFDCIPSDATDRHAITMFAKDLMATDVAPKSRARKYAFPGLENGTATIVLTVDLVATRTGEKYAICISFFEIYQDRIYDLLDEQQTLIQKRKHLPLKRDVSSGRRFVSGLRKIYADSAEVTPFLN
jgi:hypothetical protein